MKTFAQDLVSVSILYQGTELDNWDELVDKANNIETQTLVKNPSHTISYYYDKMGHTSNAYSKYLKGISILAISASMSDAS